MCNWGAWLDKWYNARPMRLLGRLRGAIYRLFRDFLALALDSGLLQEIQAAKTLNGIRIGRLEFVRWLFPVNCQLSTFNCELRTVN